MGALNRRRFFGLAAAGAVAAVRPAAAANAGQPAQRGGSWRPAPAFLDSLPALMRLASVPGLSIAVTERGAIWQRAFGVLEASRGSPVGEDSLFEAASLSKPVFAYGVLKLADQDKLDLDRPLVSYYRPPYLPDDGSIERITARHVLTHSTGLPNWGNDEAPETLKPAFPPGLHFSYSGEGYFWLQLVAEKITGLGLDAFMRRQLFEPAGMKNSMFAFGEEQLPRLSSAHRSGRPVAGYGLRGVMPLIMPRARAWRKPVRDWMHSDWIRVATELAPDAPPRRVRFQNAAGSLVTTAGDYARFLALFAEGREPAAWELSPSLRRAMIAPAIAIQEGAPFAWGLGWAIEQGVEGQCFGHEGNNDDVFTCYAIGDAAAGRGLVILTNDGGGYRLLQRITRAATGHDPLSFITNLNPPRDL